MSHQFKIYTTVRPENHGIALHYLHYNVIRKHQTIKTNPAVMAGVAHRAWTMQDLVALLEREKALLGGRLTDYKPAASKRAEQAGARLLIVPTPYLLRQLAKPF